MATRWLLLHGTPLSPQVWDEVRVHLTEDTEAPDLNELIPTQGPVQEQVAAMLASRTDGELVVVGHSFGGQVGIELSLQAPHRVARLIVVCTRHTPFPAFAAGARSVRSGQPVDINAGLRRWFTPRELAAHPPVISYLRHRLQTAPPGPWAAALDAIAHYDRRMAVPNIRTASRLFAARHDDVSPPAVMAELAAALPDARLTVVDTWAHMSPFADPAAFAATLTQAAQ